MKISAFEQLSVTEKLKTLMVRGRFISEKKNEESRVFLYSLGSFYAAVKYDIENDDLISIDCFEKIGRKERIEWKVLRVLPGIHQAVRGKSDGFL